MDTNELSFVYFPENYRWSHGLLLALNGAPWGGGEIGEIHRIGLRLRARPGDDRAWVEEWTRMWIFGVKTREDALARLEGFRLDGVVQKIRCPFLLVHGEGDEQIPLATAQKCFDAVGSTRKTNGPELERALATRFATQPADEWVRVLVAAGIGAHRVVPVAQVMQDPWVVAHGLSLTRIHAGGAAITTIGPPARLTRTPVVPGRPVSPPGADAEQILADIGMADRLRELVARGAIALE